MPHEDFDELFEALIGFAEQMLDEHGAFHPFAVAVDAQGELAHVAPPREQVGDQPAAEQVIDLLIETLQGHAEQGTIRAAGFCVDVVAIPPGETEQTDAIHIHMEHDNGEVYDVFAPYRIDEEGELTLGELFTEEGDAAIFDVGDEA
jgi:hypothetical protein